MRGQREVMRGQPVIIVEYNSDSWSLEPRIRQQIVFNTGEQLRAYLRGIADASTMSPHWTLSVDFGALHEAEK